MRGLPPMCFTEIRTCISPALCCSGALCKLYFYNAGQVPPSGGRQTQQPSSHTPQIDWVQVSPHGLQLLAMSCGGLATSIGVALASLLGTGSR